MGGFSKRPFEQKEPPDDELLKAGAKLKFERPAQAPSLPINREGLAADMKRLHTAGQARLRYALLKAKFEKDEATPDDCMHDIDENIEAYNRPNRKTTFPLTLLENSSGAIFGIPKFKKRVEYLREAQKVLKATVREYSGTVDAKIAFILTQGLLDVRDQEMVADVTGHLKTVIAQNFSPTKQNPQQQKEAAQKVQEQITEYVKIKYKEKIKDRKPRGAVNDEKARKAILYYLREGKGVSLVDKAFDQKPVVAALVEQTERNQDSDAAFAVAFTQASPELQEEYRQYVHEWNCENVSDVFMPFVETAGAAQAPTESDVRIATENLNAQDGLKLHMGENSRGEVHFGSMQWDVRLYGSGNDAPPKLLIYDRNADTGVVGPIPLTEVRAALTKRMIDSEFSAQFRKFAGHSGDNDPATVPDALLQLAVEQLLPKNALPADRLTFLKNIACLFARETADYPTLMSKIDFFRHFLKDSQSLLFLKAKQTLAKKDFTDAQANPEFSLSVFESGEKTNP